jgi:cellulose biosynthesis protein BcsQ
MHRVIEEIIECNEWRNGEFAKFKINSTGVDEALWCRMCIPMIYAHWEGYVVSSLKLLINHLNSLELPASDLPTKLVVISLKDAYRSLSGKQSFEQRIIFTDKFRELLNATVKFQNKIDTKSNLKSDVLSELCIMYGFDFKKFSNLTPEIDRLVHIRNSIAHGENSFVPTITNLNTYINAITKATDIIQEEIQNFLSSKEYLLRRNT